MFCSRSCTARMPPPNRPLPRDADDQDHGDDLSDHSAALGVQQAAESEEEDQREHVVEKDGDALAERESQVDADEGEVGFHSREGLAVSSRKTSSSEGRLMWTSASSIPCWSIQLTSSTSVRAAWADSR